MLPNYDQVCPLPETPANATEKGHSPWGETGPAETSALLRCTWALVKELNFDYFTGDLR